MGSACSHSHLEPLAQGGIFFKLFGHISQQMIGTQKKSYKWTRKRQTTKGGGNGKDINRHFREVHI